MPDAPPPQIKTMPEALDHIQSMGEAALQAEKEATHWRVVAAVCVRRLGSTVTISEPEIDAVSKLEIEETLLKAPEGGNGDTDRLEIQVHRMREDIGSEHVPDPKLALPELPRLSTEPPTALELLSEDGFWDGPESEEG